jgi:hypothetical protein
MKKSREAATREKLLAPVRRALLRAGRKVREENQRLGLPLIAAKRR